MENLLQRYWRTWAVQFVLMMALWFVFTAKVEPVEALIGVGAAALAATGDAVIRRGLCLRYNLESRWLMEIFRLPGSAVSGTAVVFRALCRRLFLGRDPDSRLNSFPFHARGTAPEAAARSAVVLAMANISPNSIVIGIDKHSRSMLVHQLEPAGPPDAVGRIGAT